jgi:hypothetical protein
MEGRAINQHLMPPYLNEVVLEADYSFHYGLKFGGGTIPTRVSPIEHDNIATLGPGPGNNDILKERQA